jgi:predicted nucleic acid-binding protein
MIVADTNIVVYLMLPGDFTAAAETLLQTDPEWVAPILWRSEFCNALALYLRKKMLTLDEALRILGEAQGVIGNNAWRRRAARPPTTANLSPWPSGWASRW